MYKATLPSKHTEVRNIKMTPLNIYVLLTLSWSCFCSCSQLQGLLCIQPPQLFLLVSSLFLFCQPLLQVWASFLQLQDFSSCFLLRCSFSSQQTPRLQCPLIPERFVCLEVHPGSGLWAGSSHHVLWPGQLLQPQYGLLSPAYTGSPLVAQRQAHQGP